MFRIKFLLIVLLLMTGCTMVPVGPSKGEKASKINVQLGIGYYQQGNLDLANEKLVKALDQDPESSQAHYAYAVLQNRFQDKEKTEFHFRKAIELDPKNSEALSNFGAFLCNDGRIEEAEKMFLRAVEDPLYKSPEVSYTNAAVCILKQDPTQTEKAKKYFSKALVLRNNYVPALIAMAELFFDEKNYDVARLYLERIHLVSAPTARSLWLDIQNELATGNTSRAYALAEALKNSFPNSPQYQSWLLIEK